MFLGKYRHTVDEKSRLSIPAKFRVLLAGDGSKKFYLTRGLDRHLLLCTAEKWNSLVEIFSKHSLMSAAERNFKRAFYSGVAEPVFDKQGRIVIPQDLLNYAEIKKDVVIAGVLDAVEIWDAEKWDASEAGLLNNLSQVAEQVGKESREKNKE